jgi:alpha-tubulin suppressor-like RCC1 family protein
VVRVAMGDEGSCAVLASGALRCWGNAGRVSWVGDNELPTAVPPVDLGQPALGAAIGRAHTCALVSDGQLLCWGENERGQLGRGDVVTPAPLGPVDLGGRAAQVTALSEVTCAVLEGGALHCWGDNFTGILGHGDEGDIGDDEVPREAGPVPLGATADAVSVGVFHACAVTGEHRVRCWGAGHEGRLGYGNLTTIGDDEPASAAGDVPIF